MVGMAVVSPYQYVWSSIEGPLQAVLDVSPATLGTVFTLFVLFQAGSHSLSASDATDTVPGA